MCNCKKSWASGGPQRVERDGEVKHSSEIEPDEWLEEGEEKDGEKALKDDVDREEQNKEGDNVSLTCDRLSTTDESLFKLLIYDTMALSVEQTKSKSSVVIDTGDSDKLHILRASMWTAWFKDDRYFSSSLTSPHWSSCASGGIKPAGLMAFFQSPAF